MCHDFIKTKSPDWTAEFVQKHYSHSTLLLMMMYFEVVCMNCPLAITLLLLITPVADIQNFCNYLINKLECLIPHNQSCYLMGNYNIDLLKHSTHNPTSEFLDLMFSNSFIPLINKLTRITSTAATLTDNIFANKYDNEQKYLTGILTTDISAHYIPYIIMSKQTQRRRLPTNMIDQWLKLR